MTSSKQTWKELPDGYLNRTPIVLFVLVSILFAMWAIASSLNDILITQFKAVFQLSDLATAFVQSAFYGGYFVIAIPASLFIKKSSYKMGIITDWRYSPSVASSSSLRRRWQPIPYSSSPSSLRRSA